MSPNELSNLIDISLPYALDLLKQMVEINSFTKNKDGVNKLGKITAGAFSYLGFKASFEPCANENYGEHLILEKEGSSDITIGLISHLDTVYTPEEEVYNDFSWREEEDKIYGPGTIDIKGGTVMIYLVLNAIRELEPEIYHSINWRVLINAAEEVLTPDFGVIAREKLRNANAALVFEFSGPMDEKGFYITSARKGRVQYSIEVFGRSAHAGSDFIKGANAIYQLSHCLAELEKLNDYERGITVNVGKIKGGITRNRVPEYAEADVEMRAFHGALFEETHAKIMELEKKVDIISSYDNYPCQIKITPGNKQAPWEENENSKMLADIWVSAAKKNKITLNPETRGGLSDGNFLWNLIPTLDGLGPFGGNPHCSEHSTDGTKEQEFVYRSSFKPKAMINVMAILELIEFEKAK